MEILKMKKAILAAFSIIAICSLCLAGTVIAAKAGYGFSIAEGASVTIDGAVSPATEWDDSYKDFLYSGWTMTTSFFRAKWDMTPNENWLIEILTDTTNDAGDFFQLSYDTLQDGAAAPQADDFLINYTGHTAAGLKVYIGTGTGWATSSAVVGTDVVVSTSIAASPASATPHWIIEIQISKLGTFAMQYNGNPRVAAYDASNPAAGVLMWPPMSSADVPDTYGTGTTDMSGTPIPEGLTIGVMVALSSVAVIVSTSYFRKQPKIKSYSPVKL
jgi:hypothetical protein